jgi:signal peptidase II
MKLSKGKWLLILGVLLVVIDQVIKVLVKTQMTLGEHIGVFGDWFQILFVENKGMAFGMSFGGVIGKYALTTFRIALFVALVWWISRLLKREKPVPTGVLVGLTLITAGALGNIFDCLFYGLVFSESTPVAVATLGHYAPFMQGKVVDMFYFPLWTWPDWVPLLGGRIFFEPVFNFADSCVTVGAIYLIFFQYKFFTKED